MGRNLRGAATHLGLVDGSISLFSTFSTAWNNLGVTMIAKSEYDYTRGQQDD